MIHPDRLLCTASVSTDSWTPWLIPFVFPVFFSRPGYWRIYNPNITSLMAIRRLIPHRVSYAHLISTTGLKRDIGKYCLTPPSLFYNQDKKIVWLSNMADIFWEVHEVRNGLWAFSLTVLFGYWLAEKANSGHMFDVHGTPVCAAAQASAIFFKELQVRFCFQYCEWKTRFIWLFGQASLLEDHQNETSFVQAPKWSLAPK